MQQTLYTVCSFYQSCQFITGKICMLTSSSRHPLLCTVKETSQWRQAPHAYVWDGLLHLTMVCTLNFQSAFTHTKVKPWRPCSRFYTHPHVRGEASMAVARVLWDLRNHSALTSQTRMLEPWVFRRFLQNSHLAGNIHNSKKIAK